nr:transposase, Ptta/En/Spm [Tanacetum cinerariifolium]
AAYNGTLVDKYGSDPANHPIYDDDLWKKCVRDDMKGGLFGWGSMPGPQYTLIGTPSTTGASSLGSNDV